MSAKKILMVAGEASGEMYGARLAEEIRKLSADPIDFFGSAGGAMRDAGVAPTVTVEEISVHGFVEVLFHLEYLFDGFQRLVTAADREQPDLVVLIDFPDFNIRLARRLKHLGAKIVYFISPQFWAWRRGRIKVLKELVEEMICILPFEVAFYEMAGVSATYVGHPLVEMLEAPISRAELFSSLALDPEKPLVAILPGSRQNEIRHNLPPLLDAVAALHSARPEIQFVLGVSHAVGSRFVAQMMERWQRSTSKLAPMTLLENNTRGLLKHCRAAIVSSGTATLETALLGTPLVCVYKVAPLSWWVGQKLIDVDYYCLVNLILNKLVVPELYQADFSPKRLVSEISRLLDDEESRRTMLNEFAGLKRLLSTESSPMKRSAQIVLAHLETPTRKSESNPTNLISSVIKTGNL